MDTVLRNRIHNYFLQLDINNNRDCANCKYYNVVSKICNIKNIAVCDAYTVLMHGGSVPYRGAANDNVYMLSQLDDSFSIRFGIDIEYVMYRKQSGNYRYIRAIHPLTSNLLCAYDMT